MEVSFYARLSVLSSHRLRHSTLVRLRLRFKPVRLFLLPFPPVMASVHIIVVGENANRENAEYAVWQ